MPLGNTSGFATVRFKSNIQEHCQQFLSAAGLILDSMSQSKRLAYCYFSQPDNVTLLPNCKINPIAAHR